MKWFEGGIGEAVQLSKTNKVIFLAAIFGTDSNSTELEANLENGAVQEILNAERFICIRMTADSNEHRQFAQIYQNATAPSIFCITDNGSTVEAVNSLVSSDELIQRLKSAVLKHKQVISGALPVSVAVSSSSSATTNVSNDAQSSSRDVDQAPLEERIERARKLAAAKAAKKLEEEAQAERDREKDRRKAGQSMAELKRWQEEMEAKKNIEERRKDKKQEQELRQRLREQIAQDRAERNARPNTSFVADEPGPSTSTGHPGSSPAAPSAPVNYTGKARLQFRLPDGSSVSHAFEQDVTLADVREFIRTNTIISTRDFGIWMTFPRREFVTQDYSSTLKDLGLLPSAALLILPSTGLANVNSGVGFGTTLWSFVTGLFGFVLYPLSLVYGWLQRNYPAVTGGGETSNPGRRNQPTAGPSNSDNPTQPKQDPTDGSNIRNRGAQGPRGQEGNVRRFRNRQDDDDDEQATWNGNSTQQM